MPADAYPAAACIYNNGVVHIQSHDCRPGHGGQADEQRPGLVPLEVIGPGLLPGVKQSCHFPGQRILSAGNATFEFVAAAAGKAEVFKGSIAALGLRDNVSTVIGWPVLASVV